MVPGGEERKRGRWMKEGSLRQRRPYHWRNNMKELVFRERQSHRKRITVWANAVFLSVPVNMACCSHDVSSQMVPAKSVLYIISSCHTIVSVESFSGLHAEEELVEFGTAQLLIMSVTCCVSVWTLLLEHCMSYPCSKCEFRPCVVWNRCALTRSDDCCCC